ncbi:hypothetical protein P168DRAFT_321306 [Aspergillus campestris IBT 28561]|uniref:Uncharacterized protein n=1 Tax=Aspergillus campestris (strain IBT 28561) TaxID=1392248 RepID=A0A2I1CVV1_ASPC2|nr:uncharacterized protein P168DRAFT_321306 [Aspergillus campestris IBT 28561]PKY01734.1 hypothetical protein P168DRAFT_321306 [Aspergillus campestris IBT 28561]
MHPSELHPAHTQLQLQLQTTLAPPTPLAVLPGTDALTLTTVPSTTTTVPSTTSTTKLTSEAHESDEDESGSTTPRPSTISFTSTSTTGTSGSGQSTPMPRRGRLVGGGVLASLRAFSSPLLMPLRGDVSSSPGSGGGSERGSGSGNGSGRRVRGAERPGVRRARTSLWGR